MRRSAPNPGDRPETEPADATGATAKPEFDVFQFGREQDAARLRPGELPGLLARAVRLTYRAAPRHLMLTILLAASTAALVGGQVLVARHALGAMFEVSRNERTIAAAVAPVIAMALLASLTGILSVLAAQLQRILAERVQRVVLRDLVDVCGAVDLEAYEDPRFFDQLQRVQVNALSQPVVVAQGIIGVIRGIAGAIVLTGTLLALVPLAVPILLVAGVPLTLTSRRASRSEFSFQVAQAPDMRKRMYLQGVLTDREGAKEIRAFGLDGVLTERWESLYGEFYRALGRQVRLRLKYALISRLAATALAGLAFVLLLVQLAHHSISVPGAGAAAFALVLLSSRVESLTSGSSGLFQSGLFLRDLENFMALGPRHRERRGELEAPRGFEELRAEGLSFRYPVSTEPVLHDVDMTIRRGEVIALVGENGSGKTTLAKILANLFAPSGGTVRWDGRDVGEYDPESVRDSVAVIFQDFLAYALSAAENIGVGRPEAIDDRDAVVAAAKQAGAHDFIARLPHAYESYLSKIFEGGRDLSRGQWQRIALARAFFRDAPLVILDEPSSALDPRAEYELFSNIRTLLTDRTVVLISHRFSSVRSADRIYVMADGRVVEHGSHDELMALDGRYAELFTLQAEAYLTSSS